MSNIEMARFSMSAVGDLIQNAEESEVPALKIRLKKFTKEWDQQIRIL